MSFKTILFLILVLLAATAGGAFYLAGQEPGPLATINGPVTIGGGKVTFDVSVDAVGTKLTQLEARIEQGGQALAVFSLAAPGDARFVQETPDRIRITRAIAPDVVKALKDGPARLILTAERTVLFGLRKAASTTARDIKVRKTPPSLSVISTHHYVKFGGAVMIVYKVTPQDVTSGVEVGDRYFPGYPASGVPGGKNRDASLRLAFFALSFDQDLTTPMRLVARDDAGNMAVAEFEHKTLADKFHRSRVPIDDGFLARVVPPILQATPDVKMAAGTADERLSAFLAINSEIRRRNAQQIETASKDSSAEMLWHGPFIRMARAASAAVFADHRTYIYGDREIDQQVHLGVDLASTKGAPIVAANAGRVLFTGFLGIYGNCVIVDHGMGVQSLYAHLSSIDVEKGDRIDAGEPIGKSGMTGLAGGDHLHFSTLVAGRPVNPIEWWDPHWIHDRIDRKLFEAGITTDAPTLAEPQEPSTKPATRVKPKPKAKPPAPAPAKPKKKR